MKHFVLAGLLAASMALGACSSLGGATVPGNAAAGVLGNLEHCDRTYQASVGLGGNGSLTISCKAKPYEAPAAQ